ncbi:hypothetical protein AgCh_023613 [Apium graveolens]
MPTLGSLSNLTALELYDVYRGIKMVCSHEVPNLLDMGLGCYRIARSREVAKNSSSINEQATNEVLERWNFSIQTDSEVVEIRTDSEVVEKG